MQRDNVIAVDFDGTIYDAKKKAFVPGAKQAVKALYEHGCILVLWTCRTGNRLKNALNILEANGMLQYFPYVNETPECVRYKTSCKVCAKAYIDDRNIGGFIGWDKVLELLL